MKQRVFKGSLIRIAYLGAIVALTVSAFQNCGNEVNLDEYSKAADSTASPSSTPTPGTTPSPTPSPSPTSGLPANLDIGRVQCMMIFSHQDIGAAKNSSVLPFNSNGGFIARGLGGTVNGDDRLFLMGSSCSADPTLIDSYLSQCDLSLGHADVRGVLPTSSMTARFDSVEQSMLLSGQVNADDNFFIRMNCPTKNSAAEPEQAKMENYVKSNCQVCFGFGSSTLQTPNSSSCSPILNTGDSTWTKYSITATGLGSGQAFNLGFFCDTQTIAQPNIINANRAYKFWDGYQTSVDEFGNTFVLSPSTLGGDALDAACSAVAGTNAKYVSHTMSTQQFFEYAVWNRTSYRLGTFQLGSSGSVIENLVCEKN